MQEALVKLSETTEMTITLEVKELNTILALIQELPAKLANPLTLKLAKQISVQMENYKTEPRDIQLNVSSSGTTEESFG